MIHVNHKILKCNYIILPTLYSSIIHNLFKSKLTFCRNAIYITSRIVNNRFFTHYLKIDNIFQSYKMCFNSITKLSEFLSILRTVLHHLLKYYTYTYIGSVEQYNIIILIIGVPLVFFRGWAVSNNMIF